MRQGDLAPEFLFLKKALYEIKARGLELSFKSIKCVEMVSTNNV